MAERQKKPQDPVTDKAIIPLTVHQVNHHLDSRQSFEGQTYENVSIIGQLQSCTMKQSYGLLLFNDGTGQIQCKINVLDRKMPSFAQDFAFDKMWGSYFFVALKPMLNQEKKTFDIVGIKQINNFNALTKHYSDVILSYLVRQQKR